MAKILSHVWSTIRGSIGGVTYTTNQFGQIIARVRTAPVNPATENQELFRASFEAASQQWRNILTPTLRQHWEDYARNITFHDPQGNYKIRGREMWLRSIAFQQYLIARGLVAAFTDFDAPLTSELPTVGPWTWSVPDPGETGFKLNVTNLNAISGQFVATLSPPYPVTRTRFKGPFNSDSMVTSNVITVGNSYTFEFNDLNEGQSYFTKLRFFADRPIPQSLSTAVIAHNVALENPLP